MIAIIKTIHTAAFVVLSVSNLIIFWGAVTGRVSKATNASLVLMAVECVVLYANNWRCPLTSLAERLGDKHGQVTDIFLPKWMADHIFSHCGGLLAISGGLFGVRCLWQASRPAQPASLASKANHPL